MTILRRLALAAAGAVAVAIVIASIATYVSTRSALRAGIDGDLRSMVDRVELIDESRRSIGLSPAEIARRLALPAPSAAAAGKTGQPRDLLVVPRDPLGGATGVAQLTLRNGLVVSSSGPGAPIPVDDERAQQVASGRIAPYFADVSAAGRRVRVFVARGPGDRSLVVARPLTEIDAALTRLRWILLFVSLGGIAVAGGLGVVVARTALRPVTDLTDDAEHVARTQDLSHRLPESGGDELARLGASFNTMLAALEGARQAQRDLVADASHELRTPLTSIRTNVELLARAPQMPAAEREAIVASATAQLEELSVLVGDLVDLARPPGALDDEPAGPVDDVRLDLLAAEAVERARRHAPAATFAVSAPAPVVVRAARAGLARAIGNLLDNAVRHGPADGRVEVVVQAQGDEAEVTVRDYGPGIAETDLPRVFDRFYRADDARARPGSGLGLAIVRQIAEQHGGHVHAERAEVGMRCVLTLPLLPADA